MMDTAVSDVVILCGGLGTRLKPLVSDRPKPMALIQGQPFLDLLVDQISSQGFSRIVFCTGHQGEKIAEYMGRRTGIDAVISREETPLGTAGALHACRHCLRSQTTLVFNGDSFCPINLASFLAEHRCRNAIATVAVVRSDGRSDAGGIVLDIDHRIMSFHEKTSGAYLNAGIYAVEQQAFDLIPNRIPCSLEYDVFPGLVGQGLYASLQQAPLHDIGTPERLSLFQTHYASSHTLSRAPYKEEQNENRIAINR